MLLCVRARARARAGAGPAGAVGARAAGPARGAARVLPRPPARRRHRRQGALRGQHRAHTHR